MGDIFHDDNGENMGIEPEKLMDFIGRATPKVISD